MSLKACSVLETLHSQYPPVISQGMSRNISIRRDYPSQEESVFLSKNEFYCLQSHQSSYPWGRDERV